MYFSYSWFKESELLTLPLHELSSMHALSERDRDNFLVSLLTKAVIPS